MLILGVRGGSLEGRVGVPDAESSVEEKERSADALGETPPREEEHPRHDHHGGKEHEDVRGEVAGLDVNRLHITRSGDDFKRFEAMVAGLEYTIYQVADTDADLGFIAEYNYDNRGTNTPQTIFQKDAFIGGRWVANDSEDTSAVLGMLIDLDDGTRSFQGEFNRRLANGLSLKTQFRALGYSNATNAQDAFRRDDFLAISLKHFF